MYTSCPVSELKHLNGRRSPYRPQILRTYYYIQLPKSRKLYLIILQWWKITTHQIQTPPGWFTCNARVTKYYYYFFHFFFLFLFRNGYIIWVQEPVHNINSRTIIRFYIWFSAILKIYTDEFSYTNTLTRRKIACRI